MERQERDYYFARRLSVPAMAFRSITSIRKGTAIAILVAAGLCAGGGVAVKSCSNSGGKTPIAGLFGGWFNPREKEPPNNNQECLQTAVNTYREVFKPLKEEEKDKKTVIFIDPFNCFSTVGQQEFVSGQVDQNWYNGQRRLIDASTKKNEVIVDIDANVPLASTRKIDSNLDKVVENASIEHRIAGETLTRYEFVRRQIDENFSGTQLSKALKSGEKDHSADFKKLLIGLIAQESFFANHAASGKGAKGMWQLTSSAQQDLCAIDKKMCSMDPTDPREATEMAMEYFDIIYGSVASPVKKFCDNFDVKDSNEVLIPVLITSYNAGYNRMIGMMNWAMKQKNLKMGDMRGEDLFLILSASYFKASQIEKVGGADAGYGSDVVSYFPKISAWASFDFADEIKKNNAKKESEEKSVILPSQGNAGAKCAGINFVIPEVALSQETHVTKKGTIVGDIRITSGFMEEMSAHHPKPGHYVAVFADGHQQTYGPGHRLSLGFDYVVMDGAKRMLTWYGGEVVYAKWVRGYGNQVLLKTDVTFNYKGHDYPVFQQYSHMASFADGLKDGRGRAVNQGQFIGIMGNTGGRYPLHVDLRTYIKVGDQMIDISLTALDRQVCAG